MVDMAAKNGGRNNIGDDCPLCGGEPYEQENLATHIEEEHE